jgi:hypothetical protein
MSVLPVRRWLYLVQAEAMHRALLLLVIPHAINLVTH